MIDDQGSPGQAEARYKWGQVLDQLRLQMTKATYDTWLAGSQVVGIEPGVWVVGVRSAYALDWLTGRLGGLVAQTVGRVAGNGVSVRFVVDASPQPAPEMDPGPPEQIIEAVREELQQILKASEYWDGKVCVLQVTNTSERTIELRALMSAADAPTAWNLRCEVREKLVSFIQRNYPDALPKVRAELERLEAKSK